MSVEEAPVPEPRRTAAPVSLRHAVARGTLEDVVHEYADLLGTAVVAADATGEAIVQEVPSGWCALLMSAPNGSCHASCRLRSVEAMKARTPLDRACAGLLYVFTAPILVGDDVVGGLSFGHGAAPADLGVLRRLATHHGLSLDEVLAAARTHREPSADTIALAKRRLVTSARLLGEIVRRASSEGAAQEAAQRASRASRRRARQELRAGRRWLEAVVMQIPAGVLLADASGRVLGANRAVATILGEELPLGAMTGDVGFAGFRTDGSRYGPDDWPLARSVITGETIVGEEIRVQRRDGSEVWTLANSAPLLDAMGAVVGAAAVVLDVTERKRAEELQERLLAVVGHDLRNPLSAVVTAAALLRSSEEGHRASLCDRISRSARRMSRILDDLTDYTRAHRRELLPIARAPADVSRVCGRVAEELSLTQPDRGIVTEGAGDPTGHWDERRLEQAVGNLAQNALRYGDRGAPVTIRWWRDGSDLLVAVHNEGAPIPPEIVARIFDPFERGDRARGPGSLGLGLFVVREIARAHGGDVSVTSGEAEGTTFLLRIPARASRRAGAE